MKHRPYIKDGTYFKTEMDDNCIYRKGREGLSLSIRAEALERCERVLINILHRGVTVEITKEEIKKHKEVKTFFGEVKYYFPVKKCRVMDGDELWVSKL